MINFTAAIIQFIGCQGAPAGFGELTQGLSNLTAAGQLLLLCRSFSFPLFLAIFYMQRFDETFIPRSFPAASDRETRDGVYDTVLTPPTTANKYYSNPLYIDNQYLSLLSLIDNTYPPQLCTICDRISRGASESEQHFRSQHAGRRRFRCLHPHCERQFNSRGALHFHLSHSHIIRQASVRRARADPPYLHLKTEPPLGTFAPSQSKQSVILTDTSSTRADSPSCPESSSSPSPIPTTPRPAVVNNGKEILFKIHTAGSFASAEKKKPRIILPTSCPCCQMQFTHRQTVIQHLVDSHHGAPPLRCSFPNCKNNSSIYNAKDDLVHHILRSHDWDGENSWIGREQDDKAYVVPSSSSFKYLTETQRADAGDNTLYT